LPANNNDLEKRLWDAADELRANSRLRAAEYSVPVLGLVFLRYADHGFACSDCCTFTPGMINSEAAYC
jgi:type I restriction enzyme M protein